VESIEAVFQAVLAAATQDGDMAAAKLLIDRVIPSRRGAPISLLIRPLEREGLRSSAPDEFISVGSDGTECPYPLA
jgi:hypothetical protein